MKIRSQAILALAASAIFACNSLAEPAPTNQPSAAPNVQNNTPGQPAGQQGQQADHEIVQQIRQFAQDPKAACDKLFLLNTAIGSMFEVQLSEQAQQKGQSDQVKQIAQHLVQDHERMNQQLKQVAQQLGVQVPQSLPQMKQEELQIFAAQSGKEFDQHYVACMTAAHAHDVAEFEGTSSLSKNAPVKQFATENLPTLQQHYQMVRQAAQRLGISAQGPEATSAGAHLHGAASGEGASPAGTGGTGASNPAGGAGGNTSVDRPQAK